MTTALAVTGFLAIVVYKLWHQSRRGNGSDGE